MKTVKLSDLCSEAQLTEIERILKAEPQLDRFKKLREYLVTQRVSLESKGVVPEYLAYALEYETTKIR